MLGKNTSIEKGLAFWRARESARTEPQGILGYDHVKRENVDGPMWLVEIGETEDLLTFGIGVVCVLFDDRLYLRCLH